MATPQKSQVSDPIEENGQDGLWNQLMQACWDGDRGTLQSLLRQDNTASLITEPDQYGYAPIHCAAYNNHKPIIKLLLTETTCKVDQPSKYSETALHIACMRGHMELAGYLLSKGANPMEKTKRENTPLHYAATSDCAELVEMLLHNRVVQQHIDDTNTAGQTAAEFAATLGCIHTLRVLRLHGANFMLKNHCGCTAVDVANRLGNTRCHAIAEEAISSTTHSLPGTHPNTPVQDRSHTRSLPASATSSRRHVHTGNTTPKYTGVPSLGTPAEKAHSDILHRKKMKLDHTSQSAPNTPANKGKSKTGTPSTPANRGKTGTPVKHEDSQSEDKRGKDHQESL